MGTVHVLPVPSQRMFPASKAAKYLGVAVDSLKKYTDEGVIKAFDFKGRRAYKLEDLDSLIDSLPEWQNGDRIKPAEVQEN